MLSQIFAREVSSASSRRLEPCVVCKLPVFLAERLSVNNQLHHRTCFRCARCHHQLSLANYYETEQGAYCCETCPDEELNKPRHEEEEENIQRVKTEPVTQEIQTQEETGSTTGEEQKSEEKEEEERKVAARQSVQNLIARFQTEKVAMVNPVPRPSVRTAFLQGMTENTVETVDSKADSSSVEDKVDQVLENKEILSPEEEPSLPPTQAPPTFEESLPEVQDRLAPEKLQPNPEFEDSEIVKEEAKSPFEDDLESETQESATVPPSIRLEDEPSNEACDKPEELAPSSDSAALIEEKQDIEEDKQEDFSSEAPSLPDGVTIREELPNEVSSPEIATKTEDDAADFSSTINPVPKPPRRSKFFHPSELPLNETPPVPTPRHSKPKVSPEKVETPPITVEEYPEDLNPFEDDEEEKPLEPKKKLVPLPSTLSIPSPSDLENSIPCEEEIPKKLIPAPKISFNPFGSDDEDEEDEQNAAAPTPPQRPPPPVIGTLTPKLEVTPTPTPSPKRAAPKPPDNANKGKSPAGTLRLKKDRPAPPPPMVLAKTEKEMNNMSLQNKSATSDVISPPSKDSYGQWKRKKGPAPPRPLPQKRQLRKLPLKEIQQELQDIEIKQQGLERQGVALEKSIRSLTETEIEGGGLTLEAEDMILQLFDLVNEKNDLLRRQAELMYLRRQQRLEEEHVELEFQIRCLMEKPASERSEQDRIREDELIQRLVVVVQKRSEIVDCLEMDRRREAEEDHSIQHHMDLYVAKNAQQPQIQPASAMPKSPLMKTKTLKIKSPAKLFKKDKKKKTKEEPNVKAKSDDADKDVDETFPETGEDTLEEKKEKKDSKETKKKWLPKIA